MTTSKLVVLLGAMCMLGSSATAKKVGLPGAHAMRFPTPKLDTENKRWEGTAQEFFYYTKLDHFDADGKSPSFKMRYLIDDTYWDPETGPILFYAGNEGDIYSFYDNTGFMTETIAQETKGLLVFGEHRYFGVSYPFDPSVAFTP